MGHGHVAKGFFRRCLPILADFCKRMQKVEFIFWARWAIFHILTQNLEKLNPAPFSRPGSAFFGFLVFFSSALPNFRRFSSNLGRFRPVFCFLGRVPAKSSKKHAMLLFCGVFAPHPNMTTLQYSPMKHVSLGSRFRP